MKALKLIPVLLMLLFCLTACGNKKEIKENITNQTIEFCDAFKTGDFQAMYNLTSDKNAYFDDIYVEGAEGSEILFDIMRENFSYEITGSGVKGKNAYVKAKVRNIDMNGFMGAVLNEFFARCEENPDNIDNISIDDVISEVSKSDKVTLREVETQFDFTKKDDKWVMDSTVLTYDDITGGYLTYYFQANMEVDANFGEKLEKSTENK